VLSAASQNTMEVQGGIFHHVYANYQSLLAPPVSIFWRGLIDALQTGFVFAFVFRYSEKKYFGV